MFRLPANHALLFMVLCLLMGAGLRFPDLITAPPGLHYDEAANALLSADIGIKGERPIFIASYTGKETLFFYLVGGMMALIGESIFALRITAAFVGVLTIAATYWMGREWQLDRRIALIAALLLTISFWHLLFSRLGFRAITQPLLQALTIAALFRGIRREKWSWLAVAGIFLGLTAYTYLAARLFPVLLLFALVPLLNGRIRFTQLALVTLFALLVLAPLLNYFIAHPDAFWVRISQVSPTESELTLPESYLKSLGMLFSEGDPYWRFNLPKRPLFDWFWGGLLLIGWVMSLWRLRPVPYDWQKSALLLLILTPIIMILPTALATNEIVPSNLRAIGLIPFIFYLPAIGLMTFLEAIEERFSNLPVTPTLAFVGFIFLVAGGLFTTNTYFNEWATREDVYYESDSDLTAVAQFLAETDTTDTTIYVSALHYQHPTIAFLSEKYEQVKWLPQSQALVFPRSGSALYIFPHNSPRPEWTDRYLPTEIKIDDNLGPDGEPLFTAFTLTAPLNPPASIPINANFNSAVRLLGYTVGETAVGDTLPLMLFWEVGPLPTNDLVPFVQLEDQWQHRWSQLEPAAYPAAQWEPGEFIIQRVDLPVEHGTPPGQYRLRVGLFDPNTGKSVGQLDEDGRYAGDAYFIDNITIAASPTRPSDIPQPPFVIDERVRPGLRLLGYERGPRTLATGEPLGATLWWQATDTQPLMNLRFELLRDGGVGAILYHTQPIHDTYPFPLWQPPQFLIDHHTAPIPEHVDAGEYRLNLRILDIKGESIYTADLGNITIEKTERIFSQPDWQYPFEANFSNEISLLGYDLSTLDNRPAILTLYWQANSVPTNDYTIFVHFLNLDGTCCAWQQDIMPQQGQYPTSRWITGEYVADSYLINPEKPLQKGRYPTEIGLYIAETGQRLQVTVPGQEVRDAVYLRPLEVKTE